jgi:hypothetical protein
MSTFQNNYSTKISPSIKLFMIRLVKHHPSWNLDTFLHFLVLSQNKDSVIHSNLFKFTNVTTVSKTNNLIREPTAISAHLF